LIEEGDEVVDSFPEGPVRDSGLAACAQAVEHYEMARYGSLVAWAKAAGRNELVQLFEETLAEEKKADTLLNQLANKELNPQAMRAAA
jgi:ferritin-like metal-binding protein YciE